MSKAKKICFSLFVLFGLNNQLLAQTVGLVLSGGGATGMAHVGVLKALEEKNIKIDYITGTSAGALIGGLYASGYSPEEIEIIAKSDNFQQMVKGIIDDQYVYYFKQKAPEASWLTLRMNKDSLLSTSLPTNLIAPSAIDFQMMSLFAGPGAVINGDFDNLMIPFACVASDINQKKSVVLEKGNLNKAIRASMTYPFYLTPIYLDGQLMFDGGLYNNFPVDVMIKKFNPDFIIGSNVSTNVSPASEDDLISQVKNMIMAPTSFEIPEGKGIMIQPEISEIGTFDFSEINTAIHSGYNALLAQLDSIDILGIPRIDSLEINNKRQIFRKSYPPLVYSQIEIEGLNKKQINYARKILMRNEKKISHNDIKTRFFKLALDDKIEFIYPTTEYIPKDSSYKLHLHINKAKDIVIELGGNFSSRPINTGYVGIEYNYFGKFGIKLRANSYFGKYYGSAYAGIRLDYPTKLPFYIEPFYALNRWDYFKSFATFFEDSKPSFIISRQEFGGLRFAFPTGNRSKIEIQGLYADIDLKYYQVENFISTDTADVTQFYPVVAKGKYERSTLNRKQYANKGTYLSLEASGVWGNEITLPGSTLEVRDSVVDFHHWIFTKFRYKNYFKKLHPFTFGLDVEGVFSTQSFFENYTASVIASPAFQSIPEMKTFFLPQFRAYQYAAGGMELLIEFTPKIELRLGSYYFQPVWNIERSEANKEKPVRGEIFPAGVLAASSALVYHSPIGPISLNLNHYQLKEDPWSFSFNFGYLIQNEKALK